MELIRRYTKIVIAFVFCVAVIAVYKTFDNISSVFDGIASFLSAFSQVFIGFVFAYILNIPIKKLSGTLSKIKKGFFQKHSFGLSIAIVYLLFLAIIFISFRVGIPYLMENIKELYYNRLSIVSKGVSMINNVDVIKSLNLINETVIYAKLTALLGSIDINTITTYATGVYNFTSGILKVVIGMIVSIYMLLYSDKVGAGIKRFMSVFMKKETADWLLHEAHEVNSIFSSYIFTRVICCCCIGAASMIAFPIIGVKYWPVMAIFIGLCDLIPYFGSIIGCVVIVVANLIFSGDVSQTVVLAVVLLILEQLDGNVLTPKVMSSHLEVSPLTVICAVLVGGNLCGMAGVVLSVPIICIVKGIYEDIVAARLEKKGMSEPSKEDLEKEVIEDAKEIIEDIEHIEEASNGQDK